MKIMSESIFRISPHQNKEVLTLSCIMFLTENYNIMHERVVHFVIKNIFDRKWIYLLCILHSFSIKNIFYDKMDIRLLYFVVAIYPNQSISQPINIASSLEFSLQNLSCKYEKKNPQFTANLFQITK